MGSSVLLIFGCVLNGFYRFVDILLHVAWFYRFVDIWLYVVEFYVFVDIWLCVAWVLLFCWYLILYCMGLIVLLIFDSVLYGFHRVVAISSCIAWVYRFIGI